MVSHERLDDVFYLMEKITCLDFEQKDISRITVWTGGRYCANEFENSGLMMTGIYQTGLNGHNLSRSG